MSCVGLCVKYKKSKRQYDTPDSKYCPLCDVFIEWEYDRKCPCCTASLKNKPRHSKNRYKHEMKFSEKYAKRQ